MSAVASGRLRSLVGPLSVAWLVSGCSGGAASNESPIDVDVEQNLGVSWEEYRNAAHESSDGSWQAEWDLTFPDEDALHNHFRQEVDREQQKLVVIRRSSTGFEPTFDTNERTDIAYCIANSFADKASIATQVAAAMLSWEAVANVHFRYSSANDTTCTKDNANVAFAVIPTTDSSVGACAGNKKLWNEMINWWGCRVSSTSAFITGVLLVNPSATLFPGQTWTGVFKHELGHILGFRHEHPWRPGGFAGCTEPQTVTSADAEGRQLTPYDSTSVMHYQQCGGVLNADYALSPLDGEGARQIYGMPIGWYPSFTNR